MDDIDDVEFVFWCPLCGEPRGVCQCEEWKEKVVEPDPRSPTLRAPVHAEQKWATHIKPCKHGYNGLCPECDAMQTPPISNHTASG